MQTKGKLRIFEEEGIDKQLQTDPDPVLAEKEAELKREKEKSGQLE